MKVHYPKWYNMAHFLRMFLLLLKDITITYYLRAVNIFNEKGDGPYRVVCRLHYVNTLKQELDGTRAYLETDTDEVSVVNAHLND